MTYYIDDPAVDSTANRLVFDLDPVASALAGRELCIGTCWCGAMPTTPPWAAGSGGADQLQTGRG
ncbi:hypothetical protein [Microtetraspora sp. NBRC 13810]|uniref:hypothetical protein n=1 Tax=Microtetraspora sp. NBRC 13810 TaxID=3030990 RepID=UPI0025537461|nr:hypothetical protein [Microtetraspora sp. NBRC 13810]